MALFNIESNGIGVYMKDALALVAKAAMLHDVGKICLRAEGERKGKKYSDLGAEFLKKFLGNSEEDQQLLRCVRCHYADDLKEADLATNDLAYIVCEANAIASGKDDIVKEEYSEEASSFNPALRLDNIFNIFSEPGDDSSNDSYFSLQKLNAAKIEDFLKDESQEETQDNNSSLLKKYSHLLEILKDNFEKHKFSDIHPNKLLRILEDTVLYVPSSTNDDDIYHDISLYDHIKITAAVATSLLRFLNNNGIEDYQAFCKENRRENTMLFVSGDFSGIQNFIYRVQTKGALRMLRGRSFYLDIVLENVIDEILEALSLSRANLIYSGGGHFYLLADNSKQTKDILTNVFSNVNRKLAEMFSGSLYLAYAWEEICADDLMDHETELEKNIFQKVGEQLSKAKLKRYDKETLSELFDVESPLNLIREGSKECGLCLRSANNLKPYLAQVKYGEDDSLEVCDICNGLYQLGKDILDDQKELFAVLDEVVAKVLDEEVAKVLKDLDEEKAKVLDEEAAKVLDEEKAKVQKFGEDLKFRVEIPAYAGKRYLIAISDKDLDKLRKALDRLRKDVIRIYAKNQSGPSEELATRLWIGDFAAKNGRVVIELSDLAKLSGGEKSETGIERLGVLRADVDNLGVAFIEGLRKKFLVNPDFYATLTRFSALSRQLSLFFKKIIVNVCKKQLPEGQEPFYLFQNKGTAERLVHIIYSGGDDIFVVGAWDDLLEFAVDLRKAFKFYTNGKLKFSGGLGLFTSTYPIRLMADITGRLEDVAKEQDGKDCIALFGESTEYRNTEKREDIPVFKWKEFEEIVYKEKLRFLLDHFAMEGLTEDTGGKKLKVGKSLLYRLLVLLSEPRKEKFNLARFAYTLARLEPEKKEEARQVCYEEVRKQLFSWSQDKYYRDDRKELVTAIRLIIYILRDKQEEQQ